MIFGSGENSLFWLECEIWKLRNNNFNHLALLSVSSFPIHHLIRVYCVRKIQFWNNFCDFLIYNIFFFFCVLVLIAASKLSFPPFRCVVSVQRFVKCHISAVFCHLSFHRELIFFYSFNWFQKHTDVIKFALFRIQFNNLFFNFRVSSTEWKWNIVMLFSLINFSL